MKYLILVFVLSTLLLTVFSATLVLIFWQVRDTEAIALVSLI